MCCCMGADEDASDEQDASTPKAGLTVEVDGTRRARERLGLAWLDAAALQEVLGLAGVLSGWEPNQAAAHGPHLDEPGLRLLTMLQVIFKVLLEILRVQGSG